MTKLQRKIEKYKVIRLLRKYNDEGLNLVDECIAQVRYERRFKHDSNKNN